VENNLFQGPSITSSGLIEIASQNSQNSQNGQNGQNGHNGVDSGNDQEAQSSNNDNNKVNAPENSNNINQAIDGKENMNHNHSSTNQMEEEKSNIKDTAAQMSPEVMSVSSQSPILDNPTDNPENNNNGRHQKAAQEQNPLTNKSIETENCIDMELRRQEIRKNLQKEIKKMESTHTHAHNVHQGDQQNRGDLGRRELKKFDECNAKDRIEMAMINDNPFSLFTSEEDEKLREAVIADLEKKYKGKKLPCE